MTGPSVLFPDEGRGRLRPELPAYAADLLLDQVFAAVVVGREDYDLVPFFATPLRDRDDVNYRQEVFADLESDDLRAALGKFSQLMRDTRNRLTYVTKSRYYPRYAQAWTLSAAESYLAAVAALWSGIGAPAVRSRALRAVAEHVKRYVDSPALTQLSVDTKQVRLTLDAIRYGVQISGPRVTVQPFDDEPDFGAEVLSTFDKFRQGAAKEYTSSAATWNDMNHIQAQIVDLVARLNPDAFAALDTFCGTYADFVDPTLEILHRQIQFYLAWLDHEDRLVKAGVDFAMPEVSTDSKALDVRDCVDLALAGKLAAGGDKPIANDVWLHDDERILVVSGPNQGGKTTFARMVGQLHHMAALGCRVPGTSARVFVPDAIYTHFEHPEDVTSMRGKLQDELIRIHEILEQATPNSVVILNEIFNSTTLEDAVTLGARVMDRLIDLDLIAVYVTFVDEMASHGPTIVSMMSQVRPDDPATRTFRVARHPADGMAYAAAIAKKYGVDYGSLKERVNP